MARRQNQNLDEGQSGLVSAALVADLRGLCFTRPGQKGDFAELAAEAGVAKSTIQNLVWMDEKGHQTQRPHLETVAKLLVVFGRLSLLEQAFEGQHRPVPAGRSRPGKRKTQK
jgi:hypothetical protein